jgi:hypothetical protein
MLTGQVTMSEDIFSKLSSLVNDLVEVRSGSVMRAIKGIHEIAYDASSYYEQRLLLGLANLLISSVYYCSLILFFNSLHFICLEYKYCHATILIITLPEKQSFEVLTSILFFLKSSPIMKEMYYCVGLTRLLPTNAKGDPMLLSPKSITPLSDRL